MNFYLSTKMVYLIVTLWITAVSCQINLRGKGASFPVSVYNNWLPAYKRYRSEYVSLYMEYSASSSSKGKTAIIENADIEYAGSDSVFSDPYPDDLVLFPTMAGAVVLGFNLPGFTSQLNLTRDEVVGIYNGSIKWWNDTYLQQINPNFVLPKQQIIVVARKDKSGTTSLFTEALSSFSPDWQSTYGSFSNGINTTTGVHDYWKPGVITFFGETNGGVSGIVTSFDYTIGYLSVADAKEAEINIAYLENAQGNFAEPSFQNVQNSMDFYAQTTSNLTFSLHNAGGSLSYPIAGFTHFIAYKTTMTNCDSAREFVRYVYWAMTDSDQREVCTTYGMAPLSSTMVSRVTNSVLKEFKCNGQSVWDMVQADIAKENEQEETWILPVSITVPLFSILLLSFGSYIMYQRIKFLRKLYSDDWLIPIEDIVFFYDQRTTNSLTSRLFSGKSVFSLQSSTMTSECPDLVNQILQWPGKWNGSTIGLRLTTIKQLNKITRPMKRKMLIMRDKIQHINIVRFYGLTDLDSENYIIGEFCAKGQLVDLLQNEKFNLTNQLKLAVAIDIAQGMQYLHSKNIVHGNLKSATCLIDSKWTIKVCDWEYNSLILCDDENKHSLAEIRKNNQPDQSEHAMYYQAFWSAPEIIKVEFNCRPTPASDVYSFAIILQEIYTREDPYSELVDLMTPEEIINAVVYMGRLRPKPSEDMPISVRQCMEISWSDAPEDRPSFDQMLKMIRRSRITNKSVLDSMTEATEEYTVLLEEKMEEKCSELNMTIQQLENILSTYIPVPLIKSLTTGQPINTRNLGHVGIICVDIRNFYRIVGHAKDLEEKVNVVKNFYQGFDDIATEYEAFTYALSFDMVIFILGMVSSEKILNAVALETAKMSLRLNSMLTKYKGPKPVKYAISSTIDVLHDCMPTSNGRYQIIGPALDSMISVSRKAQNSSVIITVALCAKIKSFDCFQLSEIKDIQVNNHCVYSLHGKQSVVPEDVHDDVIHLDDNKNSEGSVDSGFDVNVRLKPDIP